MPTLSYRIGVSYTDNVLKYLIAVNPRVIIDSVAVIHHDVVDSIAAMMSLVLMSSGLNLGWVHVMDKPGEEKNPHEKGEAENSGKQLEEINVI